MESSRPARLRPVPWVSSSAGRPRPAPQPGRRAGGVVHPAADPDRASARSAAWPVAAAVSPAVGRNRDPDACVKTAQALATPAPTLRGSFFLFGAAGAASAGSLLRVVGLRTTGGVARAAGVRTRT